jgi:hypothetical protein
MRELQKNEKQANAFWLSSNSKSIHPNSAVRLFAESRNLELNLLEIYSKGAFLCFMLYALSLAKLLSQKLFINPFFLNRSSFFVFHRISRRQPSIAILNSQRDWRL